MPNRCYRGAKVLHFSGNRVGRRAESDAVACVAASPLSSSPLWLALCALPILCMYKMHLSLSFYWQNAWLLQKNNLNLTQS